MPHPPTSPPPADSSRRANARRLPDATSVVVARVAIVLAFAFTYPMLIFLCRMNLQSILARHDVSALPADTPGPPPPPKFSHTLISASLVGGSLACAILFPNIDVIFGLLGGTTAVVLSFVAPALFWEKFVGYMYSWKHPRKLFARSLHVFALLVGVLALAGLF